MDGWREGGKGREEKKKERERERERDCTGPHVDDA